MAMEWPDELSIEFINKVRERNNNFAKFRANCMRICENNV